MRVIACIAAVALLTACGNSQEKACRDEDTTVVAIDRHTSTSRGRYGDYLVHNATIKVKRDDGTVCTFSAASQSSLETYIGYEVGDKLRKLAQ
jgi:hypothetical protein